MGCVMFIVKYLLCLFNFVFFASGAAVLGIGIWLAVDKSSFMTLTKIIPNDTIQQFNQPSVIEQGAYILIAAGALVFVVGFLGCCGACKESRLMLGLYGCFMLLIFGLELTAAILAAIYKVEAERELRSFLIYTIHKFYRAPQNANVITVSWNIGMEELHCCGVNNYTDFNLADKWQVNKTTGQVVPVACCKLEGPPSRLKPVDSTCPRSPSETNSYYKKGCYDKLHKLLMDHLEIIVGVAIGVGSIQLVASVLAFCLCQLIKYKALP